VGQGRGRLQLVTTSEAVGPLARNRPPFSLFINPSFTSFGEFR
jgi:hypothetical protein